MDVRRARATPPKRMQGRLLMPRLRILAVSLAAARAQTHEAAQHGAPEPLPTCRLPSAARPNVWCSSERRVPKVPVESKCCQCCGGPPPHRSNNGHLGGAAVAALPSRTPKFTSPRAAGRSPSASGSCGCATKKNAGRGAATLARAAGRHKPSAA